MYRAVIVVAVSIGARGWLKVTSPDGTKGWVFAAYVELNILLDAIPVAAEIPPTPTP